MLEHLFPQYRVKSILLYRKCTEVTLISMLLYSRDKIPPVYQNFPIWDQRLESQQRNTVLFSPSKFQQKMSLLSFSLGSFSDAKETSYDFLKSINMCLAGTLTVSNLWFRRAVSLDATKIALI